MALTEHEKAELDSHYNHRLETYKSMISFSVEGFKYAALLNGGAAAGMVATIDKLHTAMRLDSIKYAMTCFIGGLCFNGFAIMFAYMTQTALFNESQKVLRKGFHRWPLDISGILFVISMLMFSTGALVAVNGLKP